MVTLQWLKGVQEQCRVVVKGVQVVSLYQRQSRATIRVLRRISSQKSQSNGLGLGVRKARSSEAAKQGQAKKQCNKAK